MGLNRRTKIVLAAAVVAAICAGGTGAYFFKKASDTQAVCEGIRDRQAEYGEVVQVTEGDYKVAVLGDSYSSGFGLNDGYADGWPAQVGDAEGWATYVDGVGLTGFTNGGACGDGQYSERVERVASVDADLIIVQGGQNDAGQSASDVADAAREVLADLSRSAPVVLVGPAAPPRVDATQLAEVNRGLRTAAEATGVTFLSAGEWGDLEYQSDGFHLSPEGYAAFAAHVAEALGD